MAKKRLAILFGGVSVEHEVSLQSARNVYGAIDPAKFEVVLIGIDKQGRWHEANAHHVATSLAPTAQLPSAARETALFFEPGAPATAVVRPGQLPKVDVVFPLLHGTYGEDGTVQGLLKLADVPFVGAGVLGSAVGMDKDVAKRLLRDAGVPIARFITLTRATAAQRSFESLTAELGQPLFVKPANSGSSVGVSKVNSPADWDKARELALRFDHKLLVEEFIRGREVEVAVLGNEEPIASVPGEIIPTHEFYSYEAKYLDENGAALRIPAEVSPELAARLQSLAIQTFQVLGCAGMARVDFFVTADGRAFVNEINTLPGFTQVSMYPKLWAASGLPYAALIERLIDLAIARHRADRGLQTDLQTR